MLRDRSRSEREAMAERVVIFDTTLRDGEQSPGISLDVAEKLEIAEQLARLGVDVLEAGFPVASQGDFEGVQAIARSVEGPVICGLSRTHLADVDRCWEAVKEAGLKVTVHSGENTPASAVVETIQTVQPDRIGHGIHIIEDLQALELVRELGITLEVNPWSNYLTNSVRTIEEHPLKKLFDLGVKVTINSDDPEVLETNLNNEYRIAHEVLGMSMDDIAACNRVACEASFIPQEEKQRVWKKYF